MDPHEVMRVLSAAKIRFVLVGAYGLAAWRKEGRATEDVDLVIAHKQLKKAARVLCEAFPKLEAIDLPLVIRLRDRQTHDVMIDLVKPLQPPYPEAFKHTHQMRSGEQTYRVPSLEMALVMKFSAMISPNRATEDKHRDAHDFIRMVKNNPEYDRAKLAELGSLLYGDGGKDVLEMARQAQAGETLQL
jgi:hypothetical protein